MKRTDFKILCLIAFVVTFAACGVDWFPEFKRSATTPDSFSFTSKFGVPIQAPVSSNTVTITGFANNSTASPISVTSGSSYSINGGTPTSATGTIKNNQTVQVIQTSASSPGTINVSTLTVGPSAATFTTITQTIVTPAFRVFSTTLFPGFTELTTVSAISGIDNGGHSMTINGDAGVRFAITDANDSSVLFDFTTSLSPPFLNGNHIRVLVPNSTGKTTLTIDNTKFVIDNTAFTVTAERK